MLLCPDICTFAAWEEAFRDCDAVIHLAAQRHRPLRVQTGDRLLYYEVNTKATVRIAEAAASAGVRHFIFISSIGVNGRSTDGWAPFTEMDQPDPDGTYAETKADAERLLSVLPLKVG